MFERILRRARSLFQRERMENEMDKELRFHLEKETEENIRRGMNEQEARREALKNFGGFEKTKEECREARGIMFFETLFQDVRFGFRILIKNPGFTALAVLTLALGIVANTAIFSVVYGVLFRPLPYQNGAQVVRLRQQAPLAGVDSMGFSVKEVADIRNQNQSLKEIVEYHSMSFILLGREEPERVTTGVVSWNYFDLLGVKPIHGRTFQSSDEQHNADAVLVLSYKYWQASHGADPQIVGKTFRMNDRPHTVIGVLPPLPQYPDENDVYMPTVACPFRSAERTVSNRNARMLNVYGRLKEGVEVDRARSDMATIAGRLQQEYPDSYPANQGYTATLNPVHEEMTSQARPTLLILLGTAGLVLLITCANVANLTLARLMRREREMSIRAALGAGRSRLVRQLLTESTMLSLAGGALGLLIASSGLELLTSFAAKFTPRASEVHIDGSVLLFTLIVSIGTGIVFGLMPALTSEKSMLEGLKESGRTTMGAGRQRLRSVLIIAQVAVSFVLLIGAGLMTRSLIKMHQVDPGFNTEKVLAMRVNLNWAKYTTPEHYRSFYTRLVDKVKSMPGVVFAASSSTYPMDPIAIRFGPFDRRFIIEGRPVAEGELGPQSDYRVVSTDYFQTIGLPLIKGRAFTDADGEKAPQVALINLSAARHHWGNEEPIGKRISYDRGENWMTIVGIVGDVKQYGPSRETTDEIYRPLAQSGSGGALLVRTASDPMSMAKTMRQAVYDIDPEAPVYDVQTIEQARNESMASPRLTAILIGLFAVLALAVTAAGLTGVMALTVSQRTHEIGIRMALGATQRDVLQMVLRQGMAMVLIGLLIGIGGALVLTRVMSGLLFEVEPTDPITFAIVSLLLIAAAAAACFVPARRATTIDPIAALRAD